MPRAVSERDNLLSRQANLAVELHEIGGRNGKTSLGRNLGFARRGMGTGRALFFSDTRITAENRCPIFKISRAKI